MKFGWLTAALLLLLPGGYYLLVGRGHLREIEARHQKIQASYADAAVEPELARILEFTREVEQLQAWTTELGRHLDLDAHAAPLLLEVSAMLRAHGITTLRAEVSQGDALAPLATEALQLTVRGRFADLFAFMARIENAAPPVRITALVVRSRDGSGRVEADVDLLRIWSSDS